LQVVVLAYQSSSSHT